jgi:hypothetical protein
MSWEIAIPFRDLDAPLDVAEVHDLAREHLDPEDAAVAVSVFWHCPRDKSAPSVLRKNVNGLLRTSPLKYPGAGGGLKPVWRSASSRRP